MAGSCRSLFLRLMGAVYFCAFVSYYVQYPGLLGEDGLLPARTYWEQARSRHAAGRALAFDPNLLVAWWQGPLEQLGLQVPALPGVVVAETQGQALLGYLRYPTLVWFLCDGGALTVDQALEGLALFGAFCSALAALGIHHAAIFAALYLSYLSLYLLGQRWLGFQWDIFLLETGAMLLFYCPWTSLRSRGSVPPAAWLLRVLIAKFMYMNGVVKVTADCPTWKHLTALEYHFASTCLPTSEAWVHHQLPPLILRLGVAFMFFTELVAPFLLVVPITTVRRIGVLIQAPLQVGIMMTGNYNWFNAQTLALLLPAWDDDDYADDSGAPWLCSAVVLPARVWGRFWATFLGRLVAAVGTVLAVVKACTMMFDVRGISANFADIPLRKLLAEDHLAVSFNVGRREVHALSAVVFSPECLSALVVLVVLSSLRYAAAGCARRRPGRAGVLGAVLSVAGRLGLMVLLLPALVLCLSPCENVHRGARQAIPYASAINALESSTATWHLSTSYGLFRRMTGVAPAPRGAKGWGGLPPSVVAVPAVVIEGSDDGAEWTEIPFRYAPGLTSRAPRRTAPHQPRLDWQMWFAALGSYQSNPWLLHLIFKILSGSSQQVLQLLDVDVAPWPRPDAPPRYLRSWLYHYDFTRLDTPWARSIPGARIVNASGAAGVGIDQWWARTRVQEYTPALSLKDLKQLAQQQGWLTTRKQKRAAAARFADCSPARSRSFTLGLWCGAAVQARRLVLPLYGRSGWTFHSDALRAFWAGASDVFFVDIYFLAIVGPLTALWLLQAMVLALCRCAGRAKPARKVKAD